MKIEFTNKDAQELDVLRGLQSRGDRFMSQEEQDRMKFLQSKMYHNDCLNPHCSGYHAKSEDETSCPYCGHELHKLKTT